MVKKTIEEKLDDEFFGSNDILSEFENPEEIIEAAEIVLEETKAMTATKRTEIIPRRSVSSNATTGDLDEDYSFARDNLYNLVDKGNQALEGILSLAKEMEHPRAYEVASGLIKSVTDTTTELLKLQKELQAMKGEKPSGNNTTNNHLYVGSTADLQALLKGKDIKNE
jgi:hypothetical protein